MKKTKQIAILVITSLFITGIWAQQQDNRTPEEKAYEFRDGLYHVIEWKMGQLVGAKMRGDKAAFKRHAADMAYLVKMIPEGFIPNSIVKGSKAKQAIWENWDEFIERKDKFHKAASELAADDYDMASFDPKDFGSKNCGGCHREFKQRDD